MTSATLGAAWLRSAEGELLPLLSPATVAVIWSSAENLRPGVVFALSLVTILGAHELGHWWAARHHRLRVSLPFFLPAPIGLGTFGALLRVRTPFRTRRELLDVALAGPIAGFCVLLPLLFYGLSASQAAAPPSSEEPLTLGGGLLFTLAATIVAPEGAEPLLLHPCALAAWVGLLITALNLLPVAQLDGGHLAYALCPPRTARWIGGVTVAALGVLGLWLWPGWLLWAVLLALTRLHHPPVRAEHAEVGDRGRWAAGIALLLLALSFTPLPVS